MSTQTQSACDKREQILMAYAQAIVEDGLEKASISNVSRRAGIPTSLIFYYFKNKEDMLEQLLDKVDSICQETYFPEQKFEDDDRELVEFVTRALRVHSYREHHTAVGPVLYFNYIFQTVVDAKVRQKYFNSTENLLQKYAERLTYYNNKGIIETTDVKMCAHLLECMINGLGNTWAICPPEEYYLRSELMIDCYLQAINYRGSYRKLYDYPYKVAPEFRSQCQNIAEKSTIHDVNKCT